MVLKSKVRISSILFRFVVIMLTVAVAFLTIGLIGYLLKKGLPYVNRAFLFMVYLDLIFSFVKWQLEIMRVRCYQHL